MQKQQLWYKTLVALLTNALLSSEFVRGQESPVAGVPPDSDEFVNVHESHVNDNTVEINRTRYRLNNLTVRKVGTGQFRIRGKTEPYPDRASLIHPYLWTYIIQVVFGFIAAGLSLYAPRFLLVALVAAVLVWPLSWLTGEPIFAMVPGDFMWWMMAIKSLIVNIAPTAPMLYVVIAKPDASIRQYVGMWVYLILWANVFWTLFFPMPDLVMKVNGCVGASLCVSLIVHLFAMCRGGVTLFDTRDNVLLGYGTSLSWLVCYTVWNALFVADFAVGLTLQDILFWCFMVFYYNASDRIRSIECYFAMARPIQLSCYIAVSDWIGLIPFFRDAHGIGLDMNRHAYVLAIAGLNILFSFYVLYVEIHQLIDPSRIPQSWKEQAQDGRELLKLSE